MADEQVNAEQLQKIELMKKQLFFKVLTKEAYERLSRVKAVNQELAGQVELYLLQVYQQGKLEAQITDEQIKEVLKYILDSQNKKEPKIRRL